MSEMNPSNYVKAATQFTQAIPHAQALGLEFVEAREGYVALQMPFKDALTDQRGAIHNGALAALIDTCAGAAVMAHPKGGIGTATLDLRVDYVRPVGAGRAILARATCYASSDDVVFVRVDAVDDAKDGLVATAAGAFTVVPTP